MSEELKQIKEKMKQEREKRYNYYKNSVKKINNECLDKKEHRLSFIFIKYLYKKIKENKLNRKMFAKGVKKIRKYKGACPILYSCSYEWDVKPEILNDKNWTNIQFTLELINKYQESYLKEEVRDK